MNDFFQCHSAGLTLPETARALGVTYQAAWQRAERHGLRFPAAPFGRQPGMTKETRERAEIARDLSADGLTHAEIASVLKCSRSRVTQMLGEAAR